MISTTDDQVHPRTARRRRLVITLATAGTAVSLLASEATDPVGDGTAVNFMAAADAHQGRLVTSALLLLFSAVLLVPAVVGIVERARGRGAALADAGAVLLTLGAFGHAMAALFYLVVSALPGGPLNRDEATALVEHLNGSPAIAVAVVPIVAYGLGFLLAFIGLWRARAVPTWVLGAAVGAGMIEAVAPGGILAIAVVKQSLGLLAWGYLAWMHARTAPTAHASKDRGPQDTDAALQS